MPSNQITSVKKPLSTSSIHKRRKNTRHFTNYSNSVLQLVTVFKVRPSGTSFLSSRIVKQTKKQRWLNEPARRVCNLSSNQTVFFALGTGTCRPGIVSLSAQHKNTAGRPVLTANRIASRDACVGRSTRPANTFSSTCHATVSSRFNMKGVRQWIYRLRVAGGYAQGISM